MKVLWSPRAIVILLLCGSISEAIQTAPQPLVAERILNPVDLLQTQTEMGRSGRVLGTRELVVSGTPYIIPYRVRRGRIELLAIFHGRQRWPAKL